MSRTVPVATIIDRARRRADIENELDRFTPAELLDEVNASLARLHVILVGVRGAEFFEKQYLVYATTVATGTSPPDIQVGGFAEYDGAVVVVRGNITGPPGSAMVQVSVDNGLTFGAAISTTARVYTVPGTAITITFPDTGTYVGDNGWSSTPSEPLSVPNTASLRLPPDFFEMGNVSALVNGQRINVTRYMKNERVYLRDVRDWFGLTAPFPCYRLRGDRSRDGGELIDFAPLPAGAYPLTIFYVPQARTYVDGQSIPLDSGHEEWLILDVAIKCREKDDMERASLVARQAQLLEEITKVAQYRDANMPERVVDRGLGGFDGFGGFGGGNWR
jgi:hypothetical protein